MKGFMIIKDYPNAIDLEVVEVVNTGKEVDDIVSELGECSLDINHVNYWEVKVIDLETYEVN